MIALSLLAGVAAAAVLYVRNKKQHYGKVLNIVLFMLRTLTVGLVILLLFNPYFRQKVSLLEQPTVILAHDNSASIVLSKDSSYYEKEYPEQFETFRQALLREFQVDGYLFGQEVRDFDQLDFQDQLTDLSAVMQSVERRYYKRNVGAMLLFSDGVYNRGFDPSLMTGQLPFPVHTVVLGDSLSYPDLFVKDVHYNKKVSLGATFPVRVMVGASDCSGTKAVLTVSEDGRPLISQELEVTSNRFAKNVDFMLEADVPGVRQIEISVTGLENEAQCLNNVKRLFVEVSDQHYKILCVASAPHPDLGALKSVLHEDCEMDFVFAKEEIPDLGPYQLLILHQTPSSNNINALLSQLERNKKIPVLFVLGNATSFDAFNKLQNGVELHRGVTNSMLNVKAVANNSFATFTLSEKLKEQIAHYPPLALPHLETKALLAHDDLLTQEVLGVRSGLPLLTFFKGDRKMAILFGVNIWRWRLFNYYQDQNCLVFDELFAKTLKYLMLNADDGSAVFAKDEYYSNEPVIINAELRNPSNELVTDPELSLRIVNKKTGETYEYTFSKREHDYELNAGILPEGLYNYRAETVLAGQTLSLTGAFSVVALGIEAQQLTADVERLRNIAESTNGRCYTVDQLSRLLEDLKADARITSVEHHENRFEDLIHSKWIFFVLVGLAAIEWVLRKMFGTY